MIEINKSITRDIREKNPVPLVCTSLPIANLPTLLKIGVNHFRSDDEKLLFTYSTIVCLSGIMTRVRGTYNQQTCFPNLFFMAIAPAASGKGIMMYPKSFIEPIHNYFEKESKKKLADHRILVKASNKDRRLKEESPQYKVVLIPANCSSSKLMQHLMANSPDTPAIMLESEIDTLTAANSSDFGNYSDILRKIFHNEAATLSRKLNNEYYNILNPKLAVSLSGTPGQVRKLINNKEDGLFTRFLFMSYKPQKGWRNMGPCPTCVNLTDYFKSQGQHYFKLWEFISKNDFEVTLSNLQWERLNNYCNLKYEEIFSTHGVNATSIIKRHGVMMFKICMTLTGMRRFEDRNIAQEMECKNDDFDTALFLVDQSIYSSLEIYDSLPGENIFSKNSRIEIFYRALPDEFLRNSAIVKAEELNISNRSADRYLKELLSTNCLEQPSQGSYIKLNIPLAN